MLASALAIRVLGLPGFYEVTQVTHIPHLGRTMHHVPVDKPLCSATRTLIHRQITRPSVTTSAIHPITRFQRFASYTGGSCAVPFKLTKQKCQTRITKRNLNRKRTDQRPWRWKELFSVETWWLHWWWRCLLLLSLSLSYSVALGNTKLGLPIAILPLHSDNN